MQTGTWFSQENYAAVGQAKLLRPRHTCCRGDFCVFLPPQVGVRVYGHQLLILIWQRKKGLHRGKHPLDVCLRKPMVLQVEEAYVFGSIQQGLQLKTVESQWSSPGRGTRRTLTVLQAFETVCLAALLSGQDVTCVISGCLSVLSRSVRSIIGISFAMPILSTGPNESRDRLVAGSSLLQSYADGDDGLNGQAIDKVSSFKFRQRQLVMMYIESTAPALKESRHLVI